MVYLMDNKPLTAIEAADFLHLTPRTVRSYVKKGILKARLIGRKYLILPEEIQRFISQDGK